MKSRTLDTYYDADNFTMRNCILQGNIETPPNPTYQTGAIQFGGGQTLHANGLLFEQNLVTADYGQLLYMGHAMDNGTIRKNLFNGDSVSFGPFGERTGWVIEDNEFNGNVPGHGKYWGFGLNANLGDVVIRNNYVHEMSVGIGQISVVGGSITGNTFDDNSYAAFQLWGGEYDSPVSSNALIENNLIKYNGQVPSDGTYATAAHGIRLRPGLDASTIHMHKNGFIDLGVGAPGLAWAVRQNGTGTADAENNWWNTTVGAVIATMIGQGSADYDPWIVSYVDDPAHAGAYGFWPLNITHTMLKPVTTDALICTGESTDVLINLADVVGLYGYQFEVSYGTAYASAAGFFVNTSFDTSSPAYIPFGPPSWNAVCSGGVCRFSVTHVDPQSAFTGSGDLAKITLTGIAPGNFSMAIGNDLLSDIDGVALPHTLGGTLPITVCGKATVSGFITLQGRPGDIKDAGTVMMTEQGSPANFAPVAAVPFNPANGAYSIQVPYMPTTGSSYKIVAEHSLYLDSEDTITVSGNLANKDTRLWGGDANNDGTVQIGDLSCIGGAFGESPVTTVCGGPAPLPTGSPDINADVKVNIQDLSIAGGNFSKTSPQPW